MNAYSEGMLRDFAALRNSATHQHLALQTEIAKTSGASGVVGEAVGPAPASFVRSSQTQQSPAASPNRDSGAQPAVSLADMLQQNESMLAKLVNREKTSVSRLARQLEDAVAQRAQSEVKVVDLQARMESLDAQLISIQSSKQSTDQRCSAEVMSLFLSLFGPLLLLFLSTGLHDNERPRFDFRFLSLNYIFLLLNTGERIAAESEHPTG